MDMIQRCADDSGRMIQIDMEQ